MESGGIVRTIILTALFVVLVCDYTTLLTQLYESVASSNESRTMFVDGDESGTGDSTLDILQSPSSFREDKTEMDLEADVDFSKLNLFGGKSRAEVISIVKNVCLPKMVCELSSGANSRQLTENESALLKLIGDTTLGVLAEVPSKYHFAAHMGQLISGSDGIGCHVFYSTCPLPGMEVMKMMKKLKLH